MPRGLKPEVSGKCDLIASRGVYQSEDYLRDAVTAGGVAVAEELLH